MERQNRLSMSPAELAAISGVQRADGSAPTSLTKRQFALSGAIAGAIGGTSTTPMDVAKTRIMLAEVT